MDDRWFRLGDHGRYSAYTDAMPQTLVYYLNNCKGSDHASIYGNPRAFYDLGVDGRQATQATDLAAGQICIVCSTPQAKDVVTFSWYEYQSQDINTTRETRVFTGNQIASEELSKADASIHDVYGHFFNVDGNFKRQSVLKTDVDIDVLGKIKATSEFHAGDIPAPPRTLPEGAKRQIVVNAYERNAKARQLCIDHFGYTCAVCDFSFGETYGEFIDGFIHVHHLTPLHEIDEEYDVDPINDLIPVCPNCHAAIHYGGENRTVDELKAMMEHTAE